MADSTTEIYRPGLEGVVVAETELSQVDGERGRLTVRGLPIESLADGRFEAMAALLWDGSTADSTRVDVIARRLGEARVAAHAELGRYSAALDAPQPMDALRAATAGLSPDPEGGTAERLHLTGALQVFAAAWHRRRIGARPVRPDPDRSHAEDLLRMLHGHAATPAVSRALDAYLVTVAEHGMNASTFTARVVASTQSDAISAVVAALGSLKGPLHGGAPGPVLDMLDAIGNPAKATDWLRAELDAGRRIMGLGHRVYRVRDPRAAVLEETLLHLEAAGLESRYLALARAVERAAVRELAARYPERSLDTNVEFYTAVLLEVLGIPRELFTPLFACARVTGWLAHFEEQRDRGRIIRPRQRYVGPVATSDRNTASNAS